MQKNTANVFFCITKKFVMPLPSLFRFSRISWWTFQCNEICIILFRPIFERFQKKKNFFFLPLVAIFYKSSNFTNIWSIILCFHNWTSKYAFKKKVVFFRRIQMDFMENPSADSMIIVSSIRIFIMLPIIAYILGILRRI